MAFSVWKTISETRKRDRLGPTGRCRRHHAALCRRLKMSIDSKGGFIENTTDTSWPMMSAHLVPRPSWETATLPSDPSTRLLQVAFFKKVNADKTHLFHMLLFCKNLDHVSQQWLDFGEILIRRLSRFPPLAPENVRSWDVYRFERRLCSWRGELNNQSCWQPGWYELWELPPFLELFIY